MDWPRTLVLWPEDSHYLSEVDLLPRSRRSMEVGELRTNIRIQLQLYRGNGLFVYLTLISRYGAPNYFIALHGNLCIVEFVRWCSPTNFIRKWQRWLLRAWLGLTVSKSAFWGRVYLWVFELDVIWKGLLMPWFYVLLRCSDSWWPKYLSRVGTVSYFFDTHCAYTVHTFDRLYLRGLYSF